MMLEGKMPLNPSQISFNADGKPQTVYREVIVERNGENGGNSAELQN